MSTLNSSFGNRGQIFAQLSSDSRLHLWDVASKKALKSYVDKNHLTHSFTCYAWSSSSKEGPGLLAVGFSDGVVVIWDLNRGVVAKTIGVPKESETPTDVIFSKDGKSIFVSTNLNQIVQYSVETGAEVQSLKTGKKGVQKMALNPKVDVIAAASSSIKIIDIATGRKRKLEASLSGGISTLAFTPCGRFLAASSSRTRELLVFDARADAGSDSPVFVLPVRGILTGLDARTSGNKDSIQLLGIFEDAGGVYFELDANYSKDDSTGANNVRLETNVISKLPIIAGNLGNTGNRDAQGAVLAIGAKSSPVFRYVDLSAKQREIVLQESNIKADNDVYINGASNGHSTENALFAPEVLGPHEMGGKKRPVLSEDGDDVTAQSAQKPSKKGKTDSLIVASADKSEQSLEARLESLSASLAKLEDAEGGAKDGSAGKVGAAPTSDSLVTLIDQALQSGDDGLLEQCLACADADVVEATARRLPTSRVVLFLRKLVAKFEKRPSRGLLLTQWLSSLLRHHTAYLVTVPDLSYQLAGLSQMLEQRLASYSRLSSLAGRLDLLMSQVNYRSSSVGNAADALAGGSRGAMQAIVPMQVYQEE